MTDNQEKQLFTILNTLVTEVKGIRETQAEHSQTLDKHSQILDKHSQILDKHSQILDRHSQILDKHSQILDKHSKTLDRLDAKTDTIAEIVVKNDKRLTSVEKDVADLHDSIH